MLRLPTMRNRVTELTAIAEKEQPTYRGFLAELLMAECEDRDRRRSERAAAAMAGFRVRYVLAAKLVNELVEASDEKVLNKTIARYGRVDLICIDELGYSADFAPDRATAPLFVLR